MLNIKDFLGLGYYISQLDQFISEYRKSHPKLSASQRQEIEKYDRIYKLRDNSNESFTKQPFWNNF